MRKLISIALFTIALTVPFSNIYAEVFKISKIEIAKEEPLFPSAIIKTYQANKPVNVDYGYSIEPTTERAEFHITYDRNQTGINDLLEYGSYTENMDSTIVKNKILKLMPKLKENDKCFYVGTATLKLKDIQILIPEVASEIDTWVTIVDVLKISTPKKKCY